MVSVENIYKNYSGQEVLQGVSFLINKRDRIALVGKNGAGKTTLLRMIAGEETPTSGRIAADKEMTIGYLPQTMQTASQKSLIDEVDTVRDKDDIKTVGLMERVILGLGFQRSDFTRPCTEFSGGWRMRIELAKILLKKPDLLLLDEPTNHLDIESIQWLEQWLQQCGSAVLLVSHDRAFLDNATNRTIEITLGRIYDYNVSYSHFVQLRKERHEQQVRAYENQQKMIQETEDFIERFRYKATKAVQVQSRIKQLEKIERLEVDKEDMSRLRLRFPPAPRSGDFPVICDELRKDYGTHTVFEHVTLTIRRGEKVAFVGKNGEGKTTLVKCLMHELTDYTGTLRIGHNVKIGYFAQNQASLLDGELTVFDTIDRVATGEIRTKIKDILGAFMFGGAASEKRVRFLSGGERSRLAMIRLLLEPVNLLILDEPTNHLDMQSKDVLKTALQEFDGTLICVSHDRDFLNALVDKVYEFGGGRVKEHLGGIYDFLRTKQMTDLKELETVKNVRSEKNEKSEEKEEKSEAKISYEQQKADAAARRKREKMINETEEAISRLEQEQKQLEALLAQPQNQTQDNFLRYEHVKREINQKMYEWEVLSEED